MNLLKKILFILPIICTFVNNMTINVHDVNINGTEYDNFNNNTDNNTIDGIIYDDDFMNNTIEDTDVTLIYSTCDNIPYFFTSKYFKNDTLYDDILREFSSYDMVRNYDKINKKYPDNYMFIHDISCVYLHDNYYGNHICEDIICYGNKELMCYNNNESCRTVFLVKKYHYNTQYVMLMLAINLIVSLSALMYLYFCHRNIDINRVVKLLSFFTMLLVSTLVFGLLYYFYYHEISNYYAIIVIASIYIVSYNIGLLIGNRITKMYMHKVFFDSYAYTRLI